MNAKTESPQGLEDFSLPETRAFLLNIPPKPSAHTLKGQISLAARAGFNCLLLPFFEGGYALFESRVAREHHLPGIRPDLRKQPQLLWEIFDAAGTNDLPVYAYTDLLRVGHKRRHKTGPIIHRYKKWGAMSKGRRFSPIGRSEYDLFLCVNNEDVRRFIASLLVEIAEAYAVSGIVTDIHTYPYEFSAPQNAACFCEYCRKHVKEELQLDLLTLPLEKDNSAFRRWERWKETRLFSFVKYISGRIRNARTGIRLFALVSGKFPRKTINPEEESNSPTTWETEGLITSLITQYDADSPADFAPALERDLSSIPDDTLLATTLNVETTHQLADIVLQLRKLPLWGYFVNLCSPLTIEDAEDLSQWIFAQPSVESLTDVFDSVRRLTLYLLNASSLHTALNSFLSDVISYLDEKDNITIEKTQSFVDDFRTIQQKFQTGDIDAAFLPPETLRHLRLIKKLLKASILSTG